YFPDRRMPDPAAYGVQEMAVIEVPTEDGLVLKSWYRAPADPGLPVVLLFHGNAGHVGIRAFKARGPLDAGYGFLLAEYRGYGGNPARSVRRVFTGTAAPIWSGSEIRACRRRRSFSTGNRWEPAWRCKWPRNMMWPGLYWKR